MASGSTTYPSTNERTNYARLCRAIVDLCTDVLRKVLITLVVPSQLKNKVRTCADLSAKPLNADERNKIHVSSSTASYNNLDITFLYKLINSFSTQELRDDLSSFIQPSQIWTEVQRYPWLLSTLNKEQEANIKYASTTGNYSICDCWLLSHLLKNLCPGNSPKLLPSTNKWGGNSLPHPSKTNYGDDVERIRFLRNKVYGHVSDTCVTDGEFQTQWSELSGIMSRMDHRLKTGGRYTKDLKDIERDCMDDKAEDEFISEIKKLADADKDVRSEIGKQGEEILYLRTKVETVEKSTEQLHTSVKDLKKMEIEVSQEVKDNMSQVEAGVKRKLEGMSSDTEGTEKHHELLAELAEHIPLDSQVYRTLLIRVKAYLSPAEINNAKTDTGVLFDALERRGHLSVGNYNVLKKLVVGNIPVLNIIEKHQKKTVSISDVTEGEDNMAQVEAGHKRKLEESSDKEDVRIKARRQRSVLEERTLANIECHEQDKTFVVTKAVIKGKEILNEHGMLIYTGLSGSGKTQNAFELMAQFKETHPNWLFLKLDNVRKWSDVPLDINSLILFDDCLGSTNTDSGLITDFKKHWPDIYSCVKTGKVKVILTIRNNILEKNRIELEKYELLSGKHTIDLMSKEFILTRDIKKEILLGHCKNKKIRISDNLWDENYESVDLLDENYPIRLSERTVGKIIETDPVIGFPLSCYLFCCYKKYTKQGPEFFNKPSKILVGEINYLIGPESNPSEKVQYCIMACMMLNGGNIDTSNLDSDIFEQVVKSLELKVTRREKVHAIEQLNHRYIVKTGDNQTLEFKHQTILESVALCFYVDNAELLLKLCTEEFIREFIRPQSYKVSDGEVVLRINQNEYKYLVPRFTYSLQHGKGWYYRYRWWVRHPVMDDEQFVDCFMGVIQSDQQCKQMIQDCCYEDRGMLRWACEYGKTYLIDRLYNIVDKVSPEDLLFFAAVNGHTETVLCLLNHDIDLKHVRPALRQARKDTLTSMINHPNITLNHVIETLGDISNRWDNKTVEVILNRWPDIEQTYVLRLLYCFCLYGNRKTIDVIIKKRPDVVTQQNLTDAFSWACVGGQIDTVEYLLNIKHTSINCAKLHISQNDENLTNLHIAAYFGRFKVFIKLIELGLCVTDRTKSGLSVLNLAIQGYTCQGLDCEKVSDMIQSKSSILALYCKQARWTWFMGDVSDYTQILTSLLEHKDIVIGAQENMTEVFSWACVVGDIDAVEYLLNIKHTGINCKTLHITQNDENLTNLHIAAFFGRFKVFMKLIKLGLCVTDRTKSGLSVLNLTIHGYTCQRMALYNVSDTIKSKSSVLAQYCKQAGSRHNMGDASDYTQIIKNLLEHKDVVIEDLNITINGSTLGHYCVVYNTPSIIELLCKIYPSILSVQNNNKHKPIDLAVLMGRSQIFKTLALMGRSQTFKILYSINTEHDTNRDNLNSLLSQGKQYVGTGYDTFDIKSCPDFLNFIPRRHVISFTNPDFAFGDDREYTSIQLQIHANDDDES